MTSPGRYEENESQEIAEILDRTEVDEEFGDSSSGNGWIGLIVNLHDSFLPAHHMDGMARNYVVQETTDGFFRYESFDTEQGARAEFERLRPIYDVEEEVV